MMKLAKRTGAKTGATLLGSSLLAVAVAVALSGTMVGTADARGMLLSKSAREGLPEATVPLSAVELLQLYGDKTWKWGEGGGYFDTDGRQFRARTFDDKGGSTANGVWRITNAGKLCFRANWKSATGVELVDSCFAHRRKGGEIYQRRLPDGEWYVFKHAITEADDEFNKLVREDLVRVVDE